ncbi:DUF2726 domain-containing protein [Herbaspirillum sp. YR522]|uniref:DUF2726 domain-containing protein n=1 Tax=Herbaspirillum sp. YR522 TaxID=1144342 RepID=UPI00058B2A65|nr:DUF2726 domain-containing protein [Herbaspirillum sp. YR522]
MKTLLLPLLFLLFVGAVLAVMAAAKKKAGLKSVPTKTDSPAKKPPLTNREQAMYFRLDEVLKGHIVLAQVAFSALLKTKTQAGRNRFDRKVADFVILNKAFEVIAVIELDDASHKGRERKDAQRQTLLTDAGYRVVRYSQIPDSATLQKDFGITARVAPSTLMQMQPMT